MLTKDKSFACIHFLLVCDTTDQQEMDTGYEPSPTKTLDSEYTSYTATKTS